MRNNLVIVILISSFMTFGCVDKPTKEKSNNDVVKIKNKTSYTRKDEIATFDEFFKKFSTDKKFRDSRVIFPLKGYNSDEDDFSDNAVNSYEWQKDNWKFYSDNDFSDSILNNNIIIKEIIEEKPFMIYRSYIEDSGYLTEYKFQKLKEKWFLVYYFYMNQ